jgi:chromosomal replication initiation ATPase DnaA
MRTPERQLALEWAHPPSYAREDFLIGPENAEALNRIESWPNWPAPNLLLVGPKGAGKTHLGAIFAERAGARKASGRELAGADLAALAAGPALLIDDADAVGGAEAELFHLLNRLRETSVSALLTAAAPPDNWNLETPDLLSRLRLAPIVELQAPDAELMRAALFKLFSDRQLAVDPAVVNYLALRIDRSLDAARSVVATLDREALARGKAISRVFAAEVLNKIASDELTRREGDTKKD